MNPENVVAEFERAKKALRAAQTLYADHLPEDAVSRSYYAAMHAAKAALLVHDTIAESHAAVRRLFGVVLAHPGLVEEEWASILAKEQDRRIAADYDVDVLWESDAVSRLVEEAGAFVQRMRIYLVNAGISVV